MSTVAAPAPYSTMYINLSYKGRKLTGAITVTEWLCIEQLVERAGQPMVDRHMKINMVLKQDYLYRVIDPETALNTILLVREQVPPPSTASQVSRPDLPVTYSAAEGSEVASATAAAPPASAAPKAPRLETVPEDRSTASKPVSVDSKGVAKPKQAPPKAYVEIRNAVAIALVVMYLLTFYGASLQQALAHSTAEFFRVLTESVQSLFKWALCAVISVAAFEYLRKFYAKSLELSHWFAGECLRCLLLAIALSTCLLVYTILKTDITAFLSVVMSA